MNASPPPHFLRIYVVENDTDSRQMLTLLLKSWGHDVDSAPTMGEALAHLPGQRYDVLISDIGLPDGNGWQMMDKLRELGTAGDIGHAIAMSGYGMGSDLERSRAAGFRHHLIKPMDVDQLDTLLLEIIREIDGDA
jgi:CheY-like chemotaxis protein